MKLSTLQALIEGCASPAEMIAIARAYLGGGPLRDKVAAEAWLTRAIEAEDPTESPKAMALLAKAILHKPLLSREEAEDIRRRAESAQGEERRQLLALLALNDEDETGSI